MRNHRQDTGFHVRRIAAIMVVCSLVYYMPAIAGLGGYRSEQEMLNRLHDFYGLDFYALVFFVPVVYAAYAMGVIEAVLTSLVTILVLLPHGIYVANQAGALFRPTAFAIILSAVGAVVAMLQKSDEQKHRSMDELKCLYDIGKAAEESPSVEKFLASVVDIVTEAMRPHGGAEVRLSVEDLVLQTPGFEESRDAIREDILVGGDIAGSMAMSLGGLQPGRSNHFALTLAERIGSAVHGIDLQQSVEGYYEQLEEMVEKRTRELEQAQEKLIRSERLAAVGELASGVGHELRNPLNVIRNCVYLMNMYLDGNSSEDVLGTLKLLDQQVDISNRIVTDLLDFTRVRPPALAAVDLNRLVKESLSWITVPQNVRVVEDFHTEAPRVNVDGEQMGRAFANIISNAIQAITGDGELRISTGSNGKSAWVRFADTGCGIPEENLKRIFEPLFTTKPKGIGLGLAITRRLVEQNKGEIEVASEVAKGTTFTLKLPLKEVTENERTGECARCG